MKIRYLYNKLIYCGVLFSLVACSKNELAISSLQVQSAPANVENILLTPTIISVADSVTVVPLTISLTEIAQGAPVPPLPQPTATQTPTPTASETPTLTPTQLPTPTPGPLFGDQPYIVVVDGFRINLFDEPSATAKKLAILGSGVPMIIDGRTTDGQWYRLCCLDLGANNIVKGWALATDPNLQVVLSERVNLVATPVVPPTPIPAPFAFTRSIGPEYSPSTNDLVTIFVKVAVGEPPGEQPLPGYFLAVQFQTDPAAVVENRTNKDAATFSANLFSQRGENGLFNYKFEWRPLDKGVWTIWLTDGSERQLSEKQVFTTEPGNPNREIYIGFRRVN